MSRGPVAPPGWPFVAAIPVLVGFGWLWWATRGGAPGVLLGGLPGTLLLATGLANGLWAGDARIFHFMSLGAALGVAASLPSALVFGPLPAGALLVGSAGSFLAAGYLGLGQEPAPEGVPAPEVGPRLAARAAGDELSAGAIVLTTWPHAVGGAARRIARETDEGLGLFGERGWLRDPETYHRAPPPLEKIRRGDRRHGEAGFEHLTFESGYEPWPGEPGRDRWLSYESNRTAHAWVLRHPGEARPWLVCVHGIRMGLPKADIGLFRPDFLHRELGLNLLLPVLPLHGPRRVGLVSGDRILSGDVMDTLHAGTQAVWDLRRLTAWLRADAGATAVGVLGHSLGGYVAALHSSLDENLDCVVVGNPAVDPSRLFWRNALSPATLYLKGAGLTEAAMETLISPVSPLAIPPLVPRECRAIFAGVADRVTPPVEALDLWHHWGEPRLAWYAGTHHAFLRAREGRAVVEETLRTAGIRA